MIYEIDGSVETPMVWMMMSGFAGREALHVAAYAHLIETLGLPESKVEINPVKAVDRKATMKPFTRSSTLRFKKLLICLVF